MIIIKIVVITVIRNYTYNACDFTCSGVSQEVSCCATAAIACLVEIPNIKVFESKGELYLLAAALFCYVICLLARVPLHHVQFIQL